jgi:hypothetical protein
MSDTVKYNKLCHPYREGIKKDRRHLNRKFRFKEKQFFRRFCEILVKPRDLWLDYCGKPNAETLQARTGPNFQEG